MPLMTMMMVCSSTSVADMENSLIENYECDDTRITTQSVTSSSSISADIDLVRRDDSACSHPKPTMSQKPELTDKKILERC